MKEMKENHFSAASRQAGLIRAIDRPALSGTRKGGWSPKPHFADARHNTADKLIGLFPVKRRFWQAILDF